MIDEPIVDNETLPVNKESTTSKNEDKDTIQRCPHDETNRFSIISNALIRDMSISPECRWLIIYLLSNKEGWKINILQVINHLKPHMGKNKVYDLFDEAIESGYMKKEDRYIKNPKGGMLKAGVKYFISETPKFKKCYRLPENREAGHRDAGFREHKNIPSDKKDYCKEDDITPPIPPQSSDSPKQTNESDKSDMPAKAGEMEDKSSSSEKPKRAKPDFTPKVREVGQQMINIIITHEPEYSPPKNLAPFLTEVDFLLRTDKRDPEKIFDVLNWALSDSFWRDKMFKPNPAKYLREKFLQFKNKMEAKPVEPKKERKFAPCSNDQKAIEIMEEMSKRAL